MAGGAASGTRITAEQMAEPLISHRWQIIWQDSLLSVTFDRAPPSYTISLQMHPASLSKLSYIDVMRRLCEIGLDIAQQRATPQAMKRKLYRVVEWRDMIRDDMQKMLPHLTDIANCNTMREQLEFWNLYLHRSYIISEMGRPAIRSKNNFKADTELERSVRTVCLENLANTVEAFLGLHNITMFATQSWAAIHRSLSSALLLSILGESSRKKHVQVLVSRLTFVLSNVISTIDPSELSAPLARSVEALQKLTAQSQIGHQMRDEFFDSESSSAQGDQAMSGVLDSSPWGVSPPFSATSSEESPHAILNSIIWG